MVKRCVDGRLFRGVKIFLLSWHDFHPDLALEAGVHDHLVNCFDPARYDETPDQARNLL
jgi:hypothetical protein